MTNFIVNVREVHVQGVEIKAKNKKEAITKVENGEGEYLNNHLDYSHTLEIDTWTVDKI